MMAWYGASVPSFLAPAYGAPAQAPVPIAAPVAYAPDSAVMAASITQELQWINAQLDQLLARLTPAPPRPTGFFGQVGQFFGNLFNPTPTPAAPAPKGATSFVISSFNILSSSAGQEKHYAPAAQRMQADVQILNQHQVSVVGFQEVKDDQLADFKRLAGQEYATFSGDSGKAKDYRDAVLAWRKADWDLVKGDTLTVPSYDGVASKVPYVLLRNKQTGQQAYFVDAHNPANTKRYHHQDGYRDAAARQEAALVARLSQDGTPVFVVGDMNDTKNARQIFTHDAPMNAAIDQQPHKPHDGIDWIFGTKNARFGNYERDRDARVQKATDHAVVFARARIG